MRQPGRRSAASKIVHLATTGTRSRPTAPRCLTKAERTTFNEIAIANPHLKTTDAPILASFVQATTLSHRLGRSDRASDVPMWDRTTRMMLALARSLRLTVNSVTHPDKLGRARQDQELNPLDAFLAEDDDDDNDG